MYFMYLSKNSLKNQQTNKQTKHFQDFDLQKYSIRFTEGHSGDPCIQKSCCACGDLGLNVALFNKLNTYYYNNNELCIITCK